MKRIARVHRVDLVVGRSEVEIVCGVGVHPTARFDTAYRTSSGRAPVTSATGGRTRDD